MAKDPVCKMEVEATEFQSTFNDKGYCFCSLVCKNRFDAEPEQFVTVDSSEMPA